jgi:hypothetical protein
MQSSPNEREEMRQRRDMMLQDYLMVVASLGGFSPPFSLHFHMKNYNSKREDLEEEDQQEPSITLDLKTTRTLAFNKDILSEHSSR